MKVRMDAVCGFLEAGKTTLIRQLLADEGLKGARIVVLECEQGEAALPLAAFHDRKVIVVPVLEAGRLSRALVAQAIRQFSPDYILIEYNGTWAMQPLMDAAGADGCTLERVIGIAQAETLPWLLSGTGSLMAEQFSQCDGVLLRAGTPPTRQQRASLRAQIKGIQPRADVRICTDEDKPRAMQALFGRGRMRSFDKLMLLLMMMVPLYLGISILYLPLFEGMMQTIVQINTIFLGILLQALPFVLIGVLISSLLQVLVPDATLIGLFTRRRALGYPLALALGALFPVCDCAMIPISARLMRKGVPQGIAVAFMLAAPVVNPVVIASTLYAFPGQPMVAVARVGLGMLVALLAGLAFELVPERKAASLRDVSYTGGYMGSLVFGGALGRAEAVLRHATQELISMGQYVVLGSLLSAVIQVLVPAQRLAALGGGQAGAILVMMGAAFLMSVCATSEAFIARSFAGAFSQGPLMAFMVLGPMLDLKNLLLLSASFNRRFVAKLVAVLVPLSFVIIMAYTLLLP